MFCFVMIKYQLCLNLGLVLQVTVTLTMACAHGSTQAVMTLTGLSVQAVRQLWAQGHRQTTHRAIAKVIPALCLL